jgi:hypothetical protein
MSTFTVLCDVICGVTQFIVIRMLDEWLDEYAYCYQKYARPSKCTVWVVATDNAGSGIY